MEIELSANSELEKQQWINQIQNLIDGAKTGTTPMSAMLQRRAESKKAQKSAQHDEEMKKLDAEMVEKHEVAKRASVKVAPMENNKPSAKAPALGDISEAAEDLPPPPPLNDDMEEYDNNAIEVQKDKIKLIFGNIDKDGNGKIDKAEFYKFVADLGLAMSEQESNLIFQTVDVDNSGFICFQEFYDYFVKVVMGERGSKTDARFRAAFLKADRDGSGSINFREFAEYATSRRPDLEMSRLLAAFEELDKDHSGEISFKEFYKFFKEEARGSINMLGSVSPTARLSEPAIEDMLKGVYNQADATQLASYLHKRWKAFASFRRPGVTGDLVMRGAPGMVDDVVPGEYALIDLACFNDLPPIEPKHVVAKVTWIKSTVPGKSGRAIFPPDFDGRLPTVIATNENLAYYGASLADHNQLKVSLLYRHGIQDFTYENNYMQDYVLAEGALGGAGIERHAFAHLDCPLDDDSGFFVMGKMEGDELHLTAFKVPTRHTLYVPPNTIHTNDNLRGTWRTMLSDEAEINHVQLVKAHRQGNIESYEHFHFSFEPLV
jgi:Ca2+-binding EF-hand superfamily protein